MSLAIGSWIAGHQTPEGVGATGVPKAPLWTTTGILTARRESGLGGANFRYVMLTGWVPAEYAGQAIELRVNLATGADVADSFAVTGYWSRYQDGVVWSGWGAQWPTLPGDVVTVAANTVYAMTRSIPFAYTGAVGGEGFAAQLHFKAADGECHFLSAQMWVP